MRNLKRQHKLTVSNVIWSTEQDAVLIEHADLAMSELIQRLGFSEEDILQRKEVLGLNRRARQIQRLYFK
ncbi:acyl-CoA thioesterase [Acinetobacter sp. SH20PTE14]|uniref:acyl-CoA thioesterase n=1 Tax=Acinetobacter sp. SH20PTE14 TaxID=2905879 RepID=UPI001F2425BE|nr:acyl-CoA thioesterase [Acinetobacter sp. SH20PTE14]UIJ74587.1 acyl-CoA thioesterase [Acinetobacter sp. SH20PTE14]